MAQVQTARFPTNGPLWDEEVVPALRKRLESESRTLAKRMSAVSLSSQDDHFVSMHVDPPFVSTHTGTPASPFLQSNASVSTRPRYDQSEPRASFDRTIPVAGSRSQNGFASTPIKKKPPSPGTAPTFQRSRTYSQPYLADLPNGTTQRPKMNTSTNSNGVSKSPRLPDSRPTRIPQPASRPPASLSVTASPSIQGNLTPIPNGHHNYTTTPLQDPYYGRPSLSSENSPRTPIAIPRAHLNTPNVNVGLGLLNEPPPFNPASASSSITPSHYSDREDEAPPRPSVDSEERPFEHWYRGEVSRNGGVGELRVGRRQEMLEIANYGHTLRARERERREDGKRRKRADSVSGVTRIGELGGERERESFYLNDEDARGVGRVLDEAPLTDLEGSEGGHYAAVLAGYEDGREDEDQFEEDWNLSNGTVLTDSTPAPRPSNDTRSTTPTPSTIQQASQRPTSRNASAPPSRIPARSRQSSESRVTTPTPMLRGASEPPSAPSASTSFVSPPQTRQRQQSKPTPNGRATAKTRTAAGKATKAKTLASKKELEEEAKRRSVAYYPTTGEDGDETMIDAIPEWTQPVPRKGNWDDVVLPVVARKKGLDEHYEKADGNPTPRKVDSTIAPAPGTFGFDHSKYRPPRADGEPESIPMDEFGRPTPQVDLALLPEDGEANGSKIDTKPTTHDQRRLPARTAPSPAPFSDYAPVHVGEKTVGAPNSQLLQEDKDEGGGCCKCIIM